MTCTGQRWLIWLIFVQMFAVDHLGQPEGKHQVEETCFESIYVLWDKWIRGENSGKGKKKGRGGWVLLVGDSCRETHHENMITLVGEAEIH